MKFQLANHEDCILAKAGMISEASVRRAEVEGLVDTGATRLVLPTAVADQLGLPRTGTIKVRYADNRSEQREVVGDAELTLLDRTGVFAATLEPTRTTALIGALVMEDLDLLVDCRTGVLRPRDPDTVVNEIG